MMSPDNKPKLGNPFVCSRRVKSIENITQLSGSFRIADFNSSDELFVHQLERPAQARVDGNTVYISLTYVILLMPDQEDVLLNAEQRSRAAADIEASFGVQYRLGDADEQIKEEDLLAFAEINGRVNVIPYWREFVQSAFGRAGLPPLIVPPFHGAARLEKLKREQDESAEAT